jgi:hypothetical protein
MDMVEGFSWVVRKEYGTRKSRSETSVHSTVPATGSLRVFRDFLLRCKRYLTSTEQPKYQIYSLEESPRKGVANGVVTVISSILPVLPILMLLWVQHLLVRIGLILVFTVVFAALLVFGMHMDSDKVLAVTTA